MSIKLLRNIQEKYTSAKMSHYFDIERQNDGIKAFDKRCRQVPFLFLVPLPLKDTISISILILKKCSNYLSPILRVAFEVL